MHILVGGGSGFIGKHLCNYLREKGHRITVISRYKSPDLKPKVLKSDKFKYDFD